MRHIQFTLFADGSTDRALLPLLRWLIRETHGPDTIDHEFLYRPQFKPALNFTARLHIALRMAPCDILFIHRDAENQAPRLRYEEIANAVEALGVELREKVPYVCVVPVRMTEAWLLADESAIRQAAGRPKSTDPLDLPHPNRIDHEPDPKARLYDLLREASGKRGRRRKSFDVREAAALVPEFIATFAPLRQLSAFARLEADLSNLQL
jgi:hypothetical protein